MKNLVDAIKPEKKNLILDYDQVLEKAENLVTNTKIKKGERIGETTTGIPIEQYILGDGKYHIVIFGAMHGSEIISTDVVLRQMEELATNQELDLDELTIHFIPVLNPEGYIITTSALRTKIPRKMNNLEAEKISKEYWKAFREDDQEAIRINKIEDPEEKKNALAESRKKEKKHQHMFEDADYTCIPDKYSELKQRIKRFLEQKDKDGKYVLPRGAMIDWSANGNGVDINANSIHNPKIEKIRDIHNGKEGVEEVYNNLRYNNLSTLRPGPIGCPTKGSEYEKEPETEAIEQFLGKLNKTGNLCAYFNNHSSGGMLYSKIDVGEAHEFNENAGMYEIYNSALAEQYARFTGNKELKKAREFSKLKSYSGRDSEYEAYQIQTGAKGHTSTNDMLRFLIPGDILVENSKMGGNPSAPYGDLKGNYYKTVKRNIEALTKTIVKIPQAFETLKNQIRKEKEKKSIERD